MIEPILRLGRRPAAVMLAVLLATTPAATASSGAATPQQRIDLEGYPRLDPEELPDAERQWLERDVLWIITEAERDAYLRLATDSQRQSFREEFWRQRDPTPGTAHNEYHAEHYRRLELAAEQFGRGVPIPGWRSDRGRVYILLGEPSTISRFPNTQLAYPIELWMYSVDPILGLPPFFYVLFYQRQGFGDYRLYSPVSDGPESLLNPAGVSYAQQVMAVESERRPLNRPGRFGDLQGMLLALDQVDMELGNAALSLIPASGSGIDMAPLRSDLLLAQIEDLPRTLMPEALYAYRILTGETESEVRFETLPIQVEATGLVDPSGSAFVHYAVRAPGGRLNLGSFGDRHYVTMELSTSLSAGERLVAPAVVTPVEAELNEALADGLRRRELTYLDRLTAVPGRLRLGLLIENTVSREFARAELEVDVPRLPPLRLDSSRPILAFEYEDLGEHYDPFGSQVAFQLGRNFVLPALDGPFPTDGTLWVFHQVYVPAGAGGTVAARYVLEAQDGSIVAQKLTRLPLARRDGNGVLNQLSGISLAGVEAGRYQVAVDLGIPDWETLRLPARVIANSTYERPLVHAPGRPPAADPSVLIERARQLRAAGDTDAAVQVARRALRRDPDSEVALSLVLELFDEGGRLEELRNLLQPRLAARPDDALLLERMAELSARLGQHLDAIRYYERLRLSRADETPRLLNALAGEYLAAGRDEEAVELLQQSLRLAPEQPRIRDMIGRLQQR